MIRRAWIVAGLVAFSMTVGTPPALAAQKQRSYTVPLKAGRATKTITLPNAAKPSYTVLLTGPTADKICKITVTIDGNAPFESASSTTGASEKCSDTFFGLPSGSHSLELVKTMRSAAMLSLTVYW
jgi:hypothetical protein